MKNSTQGLLCPTPTGIKTLLQLHYSLIFRKFHTKNIQFSTQNSIQNDNCQKIALLFKFSDD